MRGESHDSREPPQLVSNTRQVTAPMIKPAPAKSMRCSVLRLGMCNVRLTTMIAATPSGTFTKKAHRHDRCCANKPPNNGPAVVANANRKPE